MKNTVLSTILTFGHIQCLHLIYVEIGWVLVSSVTQVQPKAILDPDYLPDYLFVSYEYDFPREVFIKFSCTFLEEPIIHDYESLLQAEKF